MSDEDRMDAVLRQMAAEEYNRPPHIVPREQMWDAIQQGLGTGDKGLGAGRFGASPLSRVPRWVYFAAAAVLLLAVGMQLGRLTSAGSREPQFAYPDSMPSARQPMAPGDSAVIAKSDPGRSGDDGRPRPTRPRPEPERAPTELAEGADRAYTLVAAQHLIQVEALLTSFKGDLNQGRMDAQMASWGKELLSNTRLLLDSPVASDPVRRKLLQDLELVLVQIVQLSPNTSARDRDLIKGALTDDEVLTRLRTAIPAQKGT